MGTGMLPQTGLEPPSPPCGPDLVALTLWPCTWRVAIPPLLPEPEAFPGGTRARHSQHGVAMLRGLQASSWPAGVTYPRGRGQPGLSELPGNRPWLPCPRPWPWRRRSKRGPEGPLSAVVPPTAGTRLPRGARRELGVSAAPVLTPASALRFHVRRLGRQLQLRDRQPGQLLLQVPGRERLVGLPGKEPEGPGGPCGRRGGGGRGSRPVAARRGAGGPPGASAWPRGFADRLQRGHVRVSRARGNQRCPPTTADGIVGQEPGFEVRFDHGREGSLTSRGPCVDPCGCF